MHYQRSDGGKIHLPNSLIGGGQEKWINHGPFLTIVTAM